jgi:hypothetical protein
MRSPWKVAIVHCNDEPAKGKEDRHTNERRIDSGKNAGDLNVSNADDR